MSNTQSNKNISDKNDDSSGIDYLHPEGKPEEQSPEDNQQSFEQQIDSERTAQRAQDETDGHHICSNTCQRHHEVKTMGANKS
jgi:cytochrome c5